MNTHKSYICIQSFNLKKFEIRTLRPHARLIKPQLPERSVASGLTDALMAGRSLRWQPCHQPARDTCALRVRPAPGFAMFPRGPCPACGIPEVGGFRRAPCCVPAARTRDECAAGHHAIAPAFAGHLRSGVAVSEQHPYLNGCLQRRCVALDIEEGRWRTAASWTRCLGVRTRPGIWLRGPWGALPAGSRVHVHRWLRPLGTREARLVCGPPTGLTLFLRCCRPALGHYPHALGPCRCCPRALVSAEPPQGGAFAHEAPGLETNLTGGSGGCGSSSFSPPFPKCFKPIAPYFCWSWNF